MMQTIISHHMVFKRELELKDITPTAEDFNSFSWTMLDILLFSWYMVRGGKNSPTLILSLDVSDEALYDHHTTNEELTEDIRHPWLHTLFPLSMAIGEGRWLGECSEYKPYVIWSEFVLYC